MLINNIFKSIFRVFFVVIITTTVYADGEGDGDGGGDPIPQIICNFCKTAQQAGEVALLAGLPPANETQVINYTNSMVWRVVHSVTFGTVYVQQTAGPGTSTMMTGTQSGSGMVGDFVMETDLISDMSWHCVTPWSMYCY